MAFSKKTLRYRGSKSCGRGFSRRYRGGSTGGTGNSGGDHHHKFRAIVEAKKELKARKIINLKQIDSQFSKLLSKGYLRLNKSTGKYITTLKFSKKYKKVLSEGQCSKGLIIRIPISRQAKLKTL